MATFLLAIYIMLIFIRPMEWWGPVMGLQLVTLTAVGTMFTAFPQILKEHRVMWQALPQTRWAVMLLLAVTISWIHPLWLGGINMAFQTFSKVIIMYLLVVLLGSELKSFKVLVWMLVLCVLWMAIHSMLQIHRGYGFGGKLPRYRWSADVFQTNAFGIFDDPNDLCLVFIVSMPILWALYKAEPNPALRFFSLALIPVVSYGAWLTNSRGGVMGIMGMFVAYAVARTKGFKRWFIAIVAIALVSVVAPSRFGKGFGGSGRMVPWGDGIKAWQSYPIFGVGFADLGSYTSEDKAAHNTYIQMLGECGIVGFIPFITLIYLTVLHLRRAINLTKNSDREVHLLMSGMFSAIVGFLTSSYFVTRCYNHVLYVLLGLCLAITIVACRNPEVYDRVFGLTYRKDRFHAVRFAFCAIPFLWITIKIGYAIGAG